MGVIRAASLTRLVTAAALWSVCGVAAAQTGDEADAPFDDSDRQIYANGALDVFEIDVADGRGLRWEGEVWAGTPRHRLWLRSEGAVDRHSEVDNGRLDALYDTPISAFVRAQAGLRFDLDSHPGRTWAAFGFEARVLSVFKGWATAYLSDEGHAAMAVRGSYDRLLTDRLILQPEVKLNLYSETEPARRIGSGLSDASLDFRLRYEATDRFAPYLGVTYRRLFGDTATFARADGERADDARVVIGVRSWF